MPEYLQDNNLMSYRTFITDHHIFFLLIWELPFVKSSSCWCRKFKINRLYFWKKWSICWSKINSKSSTAEGYRSNFLNVLKISENNRDYKKNDKNLFIKKYLFFAFETYMRYVVGFFIKYLTKQKKNALIIHFWNLGGCRNFCRPSKWPLIKKE